MRARMLALLCASLATPVLARAAPPQAVPIEPPPIPAPVQSGEELEPEVTIIETARGKVEEYRVAGRLYMVKVTPSVGPPYYFFDTNGDGQLDARSNDPRNLSINQWVLFRW